MPEPVPAVVMAGDRGAARQVHGENKVFLEVGGRPLVAHVVAQLQRVPEVSSVWVIGDAARLEKVLGTPSMRALLRKPLHIVEQYENLYENAWQGYRHTLPGAPPEGRDPQSEADLDHQVLYLSGDLPFATPQEISEFVRRAQASGADYAIGMSAEPSLRPFEPAAAGPEAGVPITYFNLREARIKQDNLHLARPARIGNRHYIQDMYEHRKQREIGSMIGLAWRLLRASGSFSILFFYGLIHIAGVFDRRGWRGLADTVRRAVSIRRVERAISNIMDVRLALVIPEVGGCAVDVDTEEEYAAVCRDYERRLREHAARAEAIGGPLPLPERSGAEPPPLRIERAARAAPAGRHEERGS